MKALTFLLLLMINLIIFMAVLFIDMGFKLDKTIETPLWFDIIGLISALLFLGQIIIGMIYQKKYFQNEKHV